MNWLKPHNRSILTTKKEIAELIEYYVNFSDLPLAEIGEAFGLSGKTTSEYLSKYYFGVQPLKGITITIQSKINDAQKWQGEIEE